MKLFLHRLSTFVILFFLFNYSAIGQTASDPDWQVGAVYSVAGNNTWGAAGDNFPATQAQLRYPSDIFVTPDGDIYLADKNRIRKVDHQTGIITTVAGNDRQGSQGEGGLATQIEMRNPQGIFVDHTGDLYIADTFNNRVLKVDHTTNQVIRVAGTNLPGFSGDGGPAINAQLHYPFDIFVTKSGDLYIADFDNSRIRKVDANTGIITTVAGNGFRGYEGDGSLATEASLRSLRDVAVDSIGNLYIADQQNHCIRKVDARTGIITTLAGNGENGFSGDYGPATEARLSGPEKLLIHSDNALYVPHNNRVRRIDLNTQIITTVAGGGTQDYTQDGESSFLLNLAIKSLGADANNNLYVIDRNRVLSIAKALTNTNLPPPNPSADAPVAVNDTIAINIDEQITIAVLYNDSDPNRDTLYVSDITQGQHSEQVIVNHNNTIDYHPQTGFQGEDRFTYTVKDQKNHTAQAEVIVTVTPNAIFERTAPDTVYFSYVIVDSTKIFRIGTRNRGTQELVISQTQLSGPDADSFWLRRPTWQVPPNRYGWGDVVFQPKSQGTKTATLSLTHNASDQPDQIVLIGQGINRSNINRYPHTNPDFVTGNSNQHIDIYPLSNDQDPDGDSLRVIAVGQGAHSQNVTFSISQASVRYRPKENFSGRDQFTYTITDDKGGTATDTIFVLINPIQQAPIIGRMIPSQFLVQNDTPLTIDLLGDPPLFFLANSDSTAQNNPSDSNNNDIAFQFFASSSNSQVATSSLSDSKLTITPLAEGKSTILIRAEAPNGQSATTQFDVTVYPLLIGESNQNRLLQILHQHFQNVDDISFTGPLPGDHFQARAVHRLHYVSTLPNQISADSIQTLRTRVYTFWKKYLYPTISLIRLSSFQRQNNDSTLVSTRFSFYAINSTPALIEPLITLPETPITFKMQKINGVWLVDNMAEVLELILDTAQHIPELIAPHPDLTLNKNDLTHKIPLTQIFQNNTKQPLNYSITQSNPNITDIAIQSDTLKITPQISGGTRITLIAKALSGSQVTTQFDLTVTDINTPNNEPHISLFAGDGFKEIGLGINQKGRFLGDGGPAIYASLNYPQDIAISPQGDIYIADTINMRIRKVDAKNNIISTFAGNGEDQSSGKNGPAQTTPIPNPHNIAFDKLGNLHYIDPTQRSINKINAQTNFITTIAGNGQSVDTGDGGPATMASLSNPRDLAFDQNNNLYVLVSGHVRKIDAQTETISTVVGNGNRGASMIGSVATESPLSNNVGIEIDQQGNLYIAGYTHILKVDSKTQTISLYAGQLSSGYSGEESPKEDALFQEITDMCIDNTDNLYVSDQYRIRKIDAQTGIIKTIAGTGVQGNSGNGAPALQAEFDLIYGMAIDTTGTLYITDRLNHAVRKITNVNQTNPTVEPHSPTPDFNADGQINFVDFLLFASAFGTNDPNYDLNGDGQVSFPDFIIFGQAFTP